MRSCMVNIVITVIIVAIIGVAILYIVKAKKSGAKCIGCPSSGTCGKKNCNCESMNNTK